MESTKNTSYEEASEKYIKSNSLTSSLSTDEDSSSSTLSNDKRAQDQEYIIEEDEESSTNSIFIKEVFDYNLEESFKEIKSIINSYNYIGMDTEFPGVVYGIKNITSNFYYETLKTNVNSTKLIQLGITFTNKYGEFPTKYKYHTWQFNFEFDEEKDKFSQDSINLLKNNGINFSKLKKNGINQNDFANKLLISGLVLNPNIKWVSYHGSYDFAYLLKILLKDNLPESEDEFIKTLKMYFPSFYDVRMMLRDNENLFHGGLNKLISNLNIERKGINHQAGSDSIATVEAFHKLIENKEVTEIEIKKYRNVLYGLGLGEDNKNTIKYINMNNVENAKNKNNFKQENNNKKLNMMKSQKNFMYNNNLIYLQQQPKINNLIYCKTLSFPYAFVNSYQMMRNNILINNNMNNINNIIKTNA